jgi:hypothetical protein
LVLKANTPSGAEIAKLGFLPNLFISPRAFEGSAATAMDPSEVNVPSLKDLTIDNITENVTLINSQCPNPRMKYILERIVQHLHDFARETRLSHDEWMQGIAFLTSVGQTCKRSSRFCHDA